MGVLRDVGERFGDHVISGRLDLLGESIGVGDGELDGNGGPQRELVERGDESSLGEDGRMDPVT